MPSSVSTTRTSTTGNESRLLLDNLFEAKLEDATNMNRILHELHHADEQSVLVITQDGLRLITAREKTFQISAFFASSTFHKFEFRFDRPSINFRFILREFIECLNLLKDEPIEDGDRRAFQAGEDSLRQGETKTSLEIIYKKRGDPLKLRLENNSNCSINCDLRAFSLPGDTIFSPMSISDDEEIADIVFDSRKLYEYASGLDLTSSEFVKVKMCRDSIPVVFCTESSTNGEVQLEICDRDRDIIVRDIRVMDNCIFGGQYRTAFIKPAIEALKTSTNMKMKCGTNGLLCLELFHGVKEIKTQARQAADGSGYIGGGISQSSLEYLTDYNQPQKKRSSVEYFILAESRGPDELPLVD